MLFFLVALIFWLGLAFLGASMASDRHRSAVGWFFVCLLAPLLGLLLLLILPDANAPHQVVIVEREATHAGGHAAPATDPAHLAHQTPAAHQKGVANGNSHNGHNGFASPTNGGNGHAVSAMHGVDMLQLPKPEPLEQWRYLVEYDPAIRAAANALTPLGADAQAALRDAFFALQDRALLPAIVARIQERNGAVTGAPQERGHDGAPRNLQFGTQFGASPLGAANSNGYANGSNGANGHNGTSRHLNGGSATASSNGAHHAAQSAPVQQLRAEGQLPPHQVPHQTAPVAALRSVVSPQDLAGATFLETYRGVHLFQLSDGRTYIDRHVGMPSLAHARQLIDEARAAPPRSTAAAGVRA